MAYKYDIPHDELAEMIESGMTNAEIADHFGCGVRTLQTRMKKYGLMRWEYYDFDDDELLRLYVDEDMTCQEIADLKGCCRWTIWKNINRITETRPNKRIKGKYIGENHFAWKGGRREFEGYVWIRTPGCDEIQEHRHVMQEAVGRSLESWEHVHHMDGNGLNNDPSNLILLTNSEHQKLHAAMRRHPGLDQREWLMRYRASKGTLQRNAA